MSAIPAKNRITVIRSLAATAKRLAVQSIDLLSAPIPFEKMAAPDKLSLTTEKFGNTRFSVIAPLNQSTYVYRSSCFSRDNMHRAVSIFLSAFALFLMAFCLAPAGTAATPTTLPAKVTELQDSVKDWVDGLRGKTEAEVIEQFGKDCDRTTWHSGDQKGLKLSYKLGKNSTLDLLFSEDLVVYVNFSVSSGS